MARESTESRDVLVTAGGWVMTGLVTARVLSANPTSDYATVPTTSVSGIAFQDNRVVRTKNIGATRKWSRGNHGVPRIDCGTISRAI